MKTMTYEELEVHFEQSQLIQDDMPGPEGQYQYGYAKGYADALRDISATYGLFFGFLYKVGEEDDIERSTIRND